MLSDIRHALRMLTHRPGFAVLAIGTLGLGIGATTTIFSALYRLNYAQLPYETADRLVNLGRTQEGQGFFLSPAPTVVQAWREHSRLMETVVLAVPLDVTLTGSGEPVALAGARVTPGLPEMLREKPLLGRTMTEDDAAVDAQVVVLSEALWRGRFGADPAIIGQSLRFGDDSRTVIGVMSNDFTRYSDPFPRQEFWVPYREREADSFGSAFGILREGVTPETAAAELSRIADGVEPGTVSGEWKYQALRVSEMLSTGTKDTLPILLGAVALVLLIACANVAGLIIVRLNARQREFAIRAALGARHRRILGGVVIEQIALALGAGVVGLLIAAWSIGLISRLAPDAMPLLDTLRLDPVVLLFAGTLLLVAMFFAGVVPAHSVLRRDPADALRAGGERVTGGSRVRSILVSSQVAVSLVLLVGAVLMIRSYGALQSRDLGFQAEGALVFELTLPPDEYTEDRKQAFYDDVIEGMKAIPGVSAAAVGGGAPPHLGLLFGTLAVDDSDVSTEGISYLAGTAASPGFLPALGARFTAGRDFTDSDRAMSAVVVNRSFVERFWPGDDGIGRRLKVASASEAPWIEIIGVIEDIRGSSHSPAENEPQVFYPQEWSNPTQTVVVRADQGDPLALLPAVRQVIGRSDADLPLRKVATLDRRMGDSIARDRFNMLLLSLFAAIALALSIVGLYGLVAYAVQQRVREIAIRVALGATAAAVRSLFIAHGMRLVGAGLVVGIAGALITVRLLHSMVYDLPVYDVWSFVGAIVLLGAVALLASWLPARRAASVDPLLPLREN